MWRIGLSVFVCVLASGPGGILGSTAAWAQSGFAGGSQGGAAGGLLADGEDSFLIERIDVQGNQRIETSTVKSYLVVREGDVYEAAVVDRSLKTLFATGLFADVTIRRAGRGLVVTVVENPIINRVLFVGNKALDKDKLREEILLRPRVVYTRTKVEDDVEKIVELYRRSGRFAAEVRPAVVQLPQNRVDLVFEINEGDITGIRRIYFVGNELYRDNELRDVIVTQESIWWNIFSSNDNYDPDRVTYDRELLRQFYLNNGYADFRVVSAVAELTPDRKDFYLTFTVEEGEQYAWGEVEVTTELEALNADFLKRLVPIKTGQIYNAKKIEDTIESLTFAAGAAGYAFVDIRPRIKRNREEKTLDVTFVVNEGPRVYVERIDIAGNTRTLDHVIRREFRLVEGDPYNKILVNQSRNRIRALGFFKEVEITEEVGTSPDRTVVNVEVEEQPTGELSFGFGFSSTDNFLGEISVSERNLLGRGQFLRLRLQLSDRRQQIDLRFTEPYFLGRNLAAGFELFRVATDFRESSFNTNSTGFGLTTGFPLSEYSRLRLRYTFRNDEIEVNEAGCEPVLDANGNIVSQTTFISPAICDAAGRDISSIIGYVLSYDRRNDPLRPTRGYNVRMTQDLAGLGGNVDYLRSIFDAGIYRGLLEDVIASFNVSAGYIFPLTGDEIRINDRFFRGGPTFRGFDIAGVGPRDVEFNDALGGRLFAIGSFEVSFPTGLPEDLGISAAMFADFGTVGILGDDDVPPILDANGNDIRNVIDDPSLRASVGLSVFWESPFGPVRFDLAEALLSEDFDDTQVFRFSAGSRF
ncbi:MAG: outer membrane protein assembly factor BamA [Alphaproteobacteria bacterium]